MVRGAYLPSRETLLATYKSLPLHTRVNCKQLTRLYWERVGNPYDCSFMINADIFMSYVIDYAPQISKAKAIPTKYKHQLSRKSKQKRKLDPIYNG